MNASNLNAYPFESQESAARYEAYSRLQANVVAFGEKLPIPEIVVIGGQSDGKSSLLEALLGFRFNIKEVEIGTRRPLILQMVHDRVAQEPRCYLQKEDSEEYEAAIEPLSSVSEVLKRRTLSHLQTLGKKVTVSCKPMVMKVEYAFCPNLTVIDTPGFVLKAKTGEPHSTPEDIQSMVSDLISPPNRLILFLQQSSVEWCSSLWLDFIKRVDPAFKRTIVVVSKFDNRIKEFSHRLEVDKYLSASGYLGENTRPFFIALPKDKTHSSSADFRQQISAIDVEMLQRLRNLDGGFDEEKYMDQIGFKSLRLFLETELQKRYREAAPSTLSFLEKKCSEFDEQLAKIDANLAMFADVSTLRRTAMMHTSSVSNHVLTLLNGSADPEPEVWGRTSEEERVESGLPIWTGVKEKVRLGSHGHLRLYGGAAFQRALEEFQSAASLLDCPSISKDKVANILFARSDPISGISTAVADMARDCVRKSMSPLLDIICERLAFILRSLFDIALERKKVQSSNSNTKEPSNASSECGMDGFHSCLRKSFFNFVNQLSNHCTQLAKSQLTTLTSPYFTPSSFIPISIPSSSFIHQDDFDSDWVENLSAESKDDLRHDSSSNMSEEYGKDAERMKKEVRESQLTVPETPSPERDEQEVCKKRKHHYGVASGRITQEGKGDSNHNSTMAESQDTRGRLKRKLSKGSKTKDVKVDKQKGLSIKSEGEASITFSYREVCEKIKIQFDQMRDVIVHSIIPSVLSAGFLTACQEKLSISLSVELFARDDSRFMNMFMSSEIMDELQNLRDRVWKKKDALSKNITEFKAIAHWL